MLINLLFMLSIVYAVYAISSLDMAGSTNNPLRANTAPARVDTGQRYKQQNHDAPSATDCCATRAPYGSLAPQPAENAIRAFGRAQQGADR